MADDSQNDSSTGPQAPSLATDQAWMQRALDEAALALEHGDVPIGAVLVDARGQLLGRGHNRREVDADPTAHAEVLALREAARALGHWRLNESTLYVTLEPCVMCAGALVNARLGRLVYAASDLKAGAIESLFRLADDARLNHRFPVTAGVLGAESRALLQAFFRGVRARGNKWPPKSS